MKNPFSVGGHRLCNSIDCLHRWWYKILIFVLSSITVACRTRFPLSIPRAFLIPEIVELLPVPLDERSAVVQIWLSLSSIEMLERSAKFIRIGYWMDLVSLT